jgi:ferritin-like metal-binding protein YciE
LGESEVVTLLEENLRQEEAALGKLESIAERLARGAKKPAAAR